MQVLKINNQIVDIDINSAIGIDYKAYDVAKPSSRYAPVSNNFSIPLTDKNLKIVGFAGNKHSISSIVYSKLTCEYYVNNIAVIKRGTASVTNVSDRIYMFASGREDIWDVLKKETWKQFNADFIGWLQENKNLPAIDNTFSGTFSDFLQPYTVATEGLFLPALLGNFYGAGETQYDLYLQNATSLGSHFCVYIKTIFEFIEDFYGVDFSVFDTDIYYNIFNDAIASKMYVQLKNIEIYHVSDAEFYFRYAEKTFSPEDDITIDKDDKNLYDLINIFFQTFNVLIDRKINADGTSKFILRRFDDIDNAPVKQLTKTIGNKKFFPSIEGWKQKNYITYSKLYSDAPKLTNAKYIPCYNENIEVGDSESSIFEIQMYIPSQVAIGGGVIANMSGVDPLKDFTLFISGTDYAINLHSISNSILLSTNKVLKLARIYSLASEYNALANMLLYPVKYDIKKQMNIIELNELQYFTKWQSSDLGCYYFMNKISGFNPNNSSNEITIELIKIP